MLMPKIEKTSPHLVKKRRYGVFCWQDDGTILYVALRKHNDIFTDGKGGKISIALRGGEAYWAVDYSTLTLARLKGVKILVVKLKDTGDLYFTHLSYFFDSKTSKSINYAGKGGSMQRCVNLNRFQLKNPSISL